MRLCKRWEWLRGSVRWAAVVAFAVALAVASLPATPAAAQTEPAAVEDLAAISLAGAKAGNEFGKTVAEDAAHEAAAGPEVPGGPANPAGLTPPASNGGTGGTRVGIQAGHWQSYNLPDELKGLRTSTGTAGGGVPEWQLNLDVVRKVAALLEAQGIIVDVLPATIPPGYQADAFVALHADGDVTGRLSGYKLASWRNSPNPAIHAPLLQALTAEYGAATGLSLDAKHVSRNMTGYYAFNSRRFKHSVAPTTPAVILEMGFMTNRSDLQLLLGSQDVVARGIANGILRFLNNR